MVKSMFALPEDRRDDLLAHAKSFVDATVPYTFTTHEQRALNGFFTNLDRRVFFMHTLPANTGATIGSMYSRTKNPRGVRGVFVDSFLPEILAGMLMEVQKLYDGKGTQFLKNRGIKTLGAFITYSSNTADLFWEFVKNIHVDPAYLAQFTNSQKTRTFLKQKLDDYGHNSIARVASMWICAENISILAAKSLEWARVGTGFIELSTRYVSMDGKGVYPATEELRIMGCDPAEADHLIKSCFGAYGSLLGSGVLDGPFPEFLRQKYGEQYADDAEGLAAGIAGETYDVLGNFLPAATLTSVFTASSGEAVPSILKHLALDGTPENCALRDAILREAEKIGTNQFCIRYEPSSAEHAGWQYLSANRFLAERDVVRLIASDQTNATLGIGLAFTNKEGFDDCTSFEVIFHRLFGSGRGDYDKLSREFEKGSVQFLGTMSFRGWRDLHRQSLATHRRTLLTPWLGFYDYDKPHCVEWADVRKSIIHDSQKIYDGLAPAPLFMRQYVLPLGFNVGFDFGCNLREFEFCAWQRSKWSVNHEVRQVFLAMEQQVRSNLEWWHLFSRANMKPAFVFARGKHPRELTLPIL